MTTHEPTCGVHCQCGYESPPCRVCNCGAEVREVIRRSTLVLAEVAATQAKTSAVLAASYALDAKRGRL